MTQRLPKKSKLWLLTFLALFAGCKSGPRVHVCLLDPAENGLQCSDPVGNGYFLPVMAAPNYVCLPPQDFQLVLNYAKRRCGP